MNVTHDNENIIVEISGQKFVVSQEDAVELAQRLLDVAGKVYGD